MIITEKDRKILKELDADSRQTDAQIARKVGLSKQVVTYRIKRLQELNIIDNFYTLIDIGVLGLDVYYVFFQFQKMTLQTEKRVLKEIKEYPFVGWLISTSGRWDAVVSITTKSIHTFNEQLELLLEKYGVYIHEYRFSTLLQANHLEYSVLNNQKNIPAIQTKRKQEITITQKDDTILRILAQEGRMPIHEITKKAKIAPHVIIYHLKQLLKKGIIKGFKPKINIEKLGFEWNLLLLQYQHIPEGRKKQFISFCKEHKNIYYVTETVGAYALMLDIHVKNNEEFRKVLFEFKEKFSDVIKTYESLTVFEELKTDYYPKDAITIKEL